MDLHAYLNNTMHGFLYASINRVSVSGNPVHLYRISAAEIKNNTQLQRLHESSVSEYLTKYFMVNVQYDKVVAAFFIEINLEHCVLDAQQAKDFSIAMEKFRFDHG